MIEIKQIFIDNVLHTVDADTLHGANLSGTNLSRADLAAADLIETYLRETDLIGADLSGANLNKADLRGAFLSKSSMKGANLSFANLIGTHMSFANLSRADLLRANLSFAHMSFTNLSWADLSFANLRGADLREADLREADLSYALLDGTVFVQCNTLHQAKNLESIEHRGPSSLDVATLRACVAHLPDVFLRGVGYTIDEIDYLRSYYATSIQLFSCFISYRKTDYDFAIRLHNELEANNVPCWIDELDMRGGKLWRPQIYEAIRFHDKLLLVCSEEAISRRNVVDEIITAIEQERETGEQKLFPVRLDDFILSPEARNLADKKMSIGEWREDWIRYVQAFHIPDFSGWKQHDTFQFQFDNLLRGLKNPEKR